MTATQSHAMRFDDMPAMQSAWPSQERVNYQEPPRPGGMLFTPGILGIVETAIETARSQLERTHRSMCVYEHVEWSKVEMEGWLIQQAYEGVLRDIEAGRNASHSGLLCKAAVAELAESALIRIAKIVGDSTYSRHSPYGFWLEDVWALGFLRPLWGLTPRTAPCGSKFSALIGAGNPCHYCSRAICDIFARARAIGTVLPMVFQFRLGAQHHEPGDRQ